MNTKIKTNVEQEDQLKSAVKVVNKGVDNMEKVEMNRIFSDAPSS